MILPVRTNREQAGRLRYDLYRRHPGGSMNRKPCSAARRMRAVRQTYRRPLACPAAQSVREYANDREATS